MSDDEPLARGVEDRDPGGVDALVTALHPDISASPGVRTRDVVLVTGPWLAGSTRLIDAMQTRMPDLTFVEASDLADGEAPAAVVFVTSAVAPVTASDCLMLDTAAANTDLVIGAVTKIDMHRDWRDVLAADRAAVAAHDSRYAEMVWTGVAGAPETGEPVVDELTDALQRHWDGDDLSRRNRLRAWQARLRRTLRKHEDAAAGVGREARMATLRQERSDAVREGRLIKSERTIALRSRIQQAKVQLSYFARKRCTSVRGELAEDAAKMNRRRLPEFEVYVAQRLQEVVREVDTGVDKEVGDLATEFGLTCPPGEQLPDTPAVVRPLVNVGGLEARLMLVFGAVFGLGIALTVSRLFADVARAYTVAGLIGGAAIGVAVAAWVISMRRALRNRAVLEKWLNDLLTELRAVVEQFVMTRMLHAESALTAEQARLDDAAGADISDRLAAIDAELREHAVAGAQATAVRDRELPSLQRALDAVHAELEGRRQLDGNTSN
jgi:hypothetical protein